MAKLIPDFVAHKKSGKVLIIDHFSLKHLDNVAHTSAERSRDVIARTGDVLRELPDVDEKARPEQKEIIERRERWNL